MWATEIEPAEIAEGNIVLQHYTNQALRKKMFLVKRLVTILFHQSSKFRIDEHDPPLPKMPGQIIIKKVPINFVRSLSPQTK